MGEPTERAPPHCVRTVIIIAPERPNSIKNLKQWVCWRLEERGGKPTKVPYSPISGRRASSTNPDTWGSYEEAVAARDSGGYDGVGFVFTPDDPYTGVDLDGCRDAETGEIEPWAQSIIDELDSYTETSPSETGVHVILRGELPPGRNRNGRFETYDRGRYFTVTGEHLPDTPHAIESRQEALESILGRVFEEPNRNGHEEPPAAPGAATGLSDEEIIKRAGAAKNGRKFSQLWSGDISDYPSDSEADLALCSILAFWTGPDTARIGSLFRRSGLYREKWNREDYREDTINKALNGKTDYYEPGRVPGEADGETGGGEQTQAEKLIRLADDAELFHTPAGDSYATVQVGGHHETHPIKSKGFRRWLLRAFYASQNRPPGAQALQDALGLLEARAEFDGEQRKVFVRVAEHDGAIFIDLSNERWEVVEITATGWRVVSGEDAPVRFRRPRGMLALPSPVSDESGADELLRRFLNVESDEDLRLVVAWLVAALRPTGPYPVLLLQGEQGSAKSTAERLIRDLVDPATAPLRTTPRSEHDLFISADNAHVVALDNISSLQPWLSDALCRLSTGGGFSTRMLYEGREEELFDGIRPILLNGITDIATRPDLLDRSLIVTLPAIPEDSRRHEKELWKEFENDRPALLGALLDGVVGALTQVDDVRLGVLPRMADFAVWITAAEESLGWGPGSFMSAYTGNREAATDTALEADPVAEAIQKLMESQGEWTGTATELWGALNEQVDEDVRRTKVWPGAPNSLTGRLKRLAPTLRGVGISYDEVRVGRSGRKQKRLTKNIGAKDRQSRQSRQHEENPLQNGVFDADDADGKTVSANDTPIEDRQHEFPIDTGNQDDADGSDDADDGLQAYSSPLSPPPDADSADDDLSPDSKSPENVPEDVRALLSNPPGWLKHQLEHIGKQGYPARLLKPTAASMSAELYGSPLLARDEILPVLEAFVRGENEDEEEVHIL